MRSYGKDSGNEVGGQGPKAVYSAVRPSYSAFDALFEAETRSRTAAVAPQYQVFGGDPTCFIHVGAP